MKVEPIESVALAELLGVIAALRGAGGCPWDRKQTLESLKPFLVEECCELLDALDGDSVDAHRDELGDVLLQILLQSRIREEQGAFGFDGVAAHLRDKLIRRHPHVFGSVDAETAEDVVRNWNAIKEQERSAELPRRTLEGLPSELPALLRAQRLQARAARHGFDWDETEPVLDKIGEEVQEVREAIALDDKPAIADELGDLLFAIVNLCRFQGVDAESALRGACGKFSRRFHAMEDRLVRSCENMEDCSLDRLDQEWEAVKAEEAQGTNKE
ncbi:MAG: nucleoside triphosphate pyrophosphohydrolase [Kiritimatiellia bacterium]